MPLKKEQTKDPYHFVYHADKDLLTFYIQNISLESKYGVDL